MQKEIQLTKPLQIAIYLTIVLILISSVFLFSTLNTDMFGKAVGETCQTNEECGELELCENNVCVEAVPEEPEEETDETGADETQGQIFTGCSPECIEGETCENNVCVEAVPEEPEEETDETGAGETQGQIFTGCSPDCIEGQHCENGACVEDVVTAATQEPEQTPTECIPACAEGETCENNICVSAVPDTLTECIPACTQGEICNEGICETPLGCTDDLNCAANEVCNTATGECVSKPITPLPAKTIPTSTANTSGSTPIPTIPTPECTLTSSSKDCAAGFGCDSAGKCKTSCSEQTPADCQQGFLCFEEICDLDIIDCMNDNGEPDNTKCTTGMFCSQDYLICIQCDEQHKCAKDFVCSSMGVCQPAGYEEEDYSDVLEQQETPPNQQVGLQESFSELSQPPLLETEQLPGQLPSEGIGLDGLAGGEQINEPSGETSYDESASEPEQESELGQEQELTFSQQQTQQMAAQQQQKLKQEFGAEKGVVGKALTTQPNVSILAKGKTYWWGVVAFVLIGSLIASLIFMHKRELALKNQSTNQTTQPTTQGTTSMQSPRFLQQNNMNMQQTKVQNVQSAMSAMSTQSTQSTYQTTPQLAQQTSAIEQNFVNYVEAQLENGLTKDQVIIQLINLGWDKNIIQELFTKYHAMFMDKNEREQILNYIRYYTAKGLPKESITSALIKAGWSKEAIESLIKNY